MTTTITQNAGKTQIAGKKTKHIMTVQNVEHIRTSSTKYNYGVVVEFFDTAFVICSKNPITEGRVKSEPYQGLTSLIGAPWNQKSRIKRENKQLINQWIQNGDLKMHFFTFNQ
jgi:hypothetical protein